MTDIQLYTKLSMLPPGLKKQAENFIDFLSLKVKKQPSKVKRKAGLAEGLIKMKDNWDEPIEGMKEYM